MENQRLELSSGKVVEWRDLNGFESVSADAIAGFLMGNAKPTTAIMSLVVTKVYTFCSIRSVNGAPVSPLDGDKEFETLASSFTPSETMELMNAILPAPPKGDELKNSSADQPSNPSPEQS